MSEELSWELYDLFDSERYAFPIYDHASARRIVRYLLYRGVLDEEIADAIEDSTSDLKIWLNRAGKAMVGEWVIAWVNEVNDEYRRDKQRRGSMLPDHYASEVTSLSHGLHDDHAGSSGHDVGHQTAVLSTDSDIKYALMSDLNDEPQTRRGQPAARKKCGNTLTVPLADTHLYEAPRKTSRLFGQSSDTLSSITLVCPPRPAGPTRVGAAPYVTMATSSVCQFDTCAANIKQCDHSVGECLAIKNKTSPEPGLTVPVVSMLEPSSVDTAVSTNHVDLTPGDINCNSRHYIDTNSAKDCAVEIVIDECEDSAEEKRDVKTRVSEQEGQGQQIKGEVRKAEGDNGVTLHCNGKQQTSSITSTDQSVSKRRQSYQLGDQPGPGADSYRYGELSGRRAMRTGAKRKGGAMGNRHKPHRLSRMTGTLGRHMVMSSYDTDYVDMLYSSPFLGRDPGYGRSSSSRLSHNRYTCAIDEDFDYDYEALSNSAQDVSEDTTCITSDSVVDTGDSKTVSDTRH